MRTIGSLAVFIFAAVRAFAQATVHFANYVPWVDPAVDAPFSDDRGVRLAGPNYVAQLYVWKQGDDFIPVSSPVAFGTNGYFDGLLVYLPPFIAPGASAWLQVRAWQIEGGTTFEQAALAGVWTGLSEDLFVPNTGGAGAPPMGPAPLIGLKYPGAPLIVRQPQDQTVLARKRATLSVIASIGVGVSYQWYQQPSDRPDGLIPGATNATFTTPPLFTNTSFRVIATNSAGAMTSERATVTVVGPSVPWLTVGLDGRVPLLTLEGVPGVLHQVEYSTDLGAASWTPLEEILLIAGTYTFHDDEATNSVTRFYRAVAQQ